MRNSPIIVLNSAKQLPPRHEILCEVLVFLFQVERQLEDWPEKAQRETRAGGRLLDQRDRA